MTVVLIVFLLISFIFNVVFVYKCLSLNDKIEELTIDIEESLEIIDKSYASIANALKNMYVTDDDPMIRKLIQDIKNVHDVLLLIANKIVQFESSDDEPTTEK